MKRKCTCDKKETSKRVYLSSRSAWGLLADWEIGCLLLVCRLASMQGCRLCLHPKWKSAYLTWPMMIGQQLGNACYQIWSKGASKDKTDSNSMELWIEGRGLRFASNKSGKRAPKIEQTTVGEMKGICFCCNSLQAPFISFHFVTFRFATSKKSSGLIVSNVYLFIIN